MKKAIYPGSFDPITFGHLDLIKRAAGMFGSLTVVVLNNSQKNSLFSAPERVSMIRGILDSEGLSDVVVDTNDGLLVDYARSTGADLIVRGLRAISDFDYELQIAQVNHVQYENLETVFLATSLNYSYLSSSIVREFASYGGDISKFIPESIVPLVEQKYKNKS